MNTNPIKEFASAVADAYVTQYHSDSPVMGTPIVYYNRTTGFGWCSSLTPLSDDEIILERVEEGNYGDTTDSTLDEIRQGIIELVVMTTTLEDLPDECWRQ
jgi:hypothetical protein